MSRGLGRRGANGLDEFWWRLGAYLYTCRFSLSQKKNVPPSFLFSGGGFLPKGPFKSLHTINLKYSVVKRNILLFNWFLLYTLRRLLSPVHVLSMEFLHFLWNEKQVFFLFGVCRLLDACQMNVINSPHFVLFFLYWNSLSFFVKLYLAIVLIRVHYVWKSLGTWKIREWKKKWH